MRVWADLHEHATASSCVRLRASEADGHDVTLTARPLPTKWSSRDWGPRTRPRTHGGVSRLGKARAALAQRHSRAFGRGRRLHCSLAQVLLTSPACRFRGFEYDQFDYDGRRSSTTNAVSPIRSSARPIPAGGRRIEPAHRARPLPALQEGIPRRLRARLAASNELQLSTTLSSALSDGFPMLSTSRVGEDLLRCFFGRPLRRADADGRPRADSEPARGDPDVVLDRLHIPSVRWR